MLTFEGQQVQGSQQIIQKLKGVGQVKHTVKTTDIQPSSNPNAIVIFVTGAIQIGGDNPLHFCEFFQLVGTAPGQYCKLNIDSSCLNSLVAHNTNSLLDLCNLLYL